jgi:hypothetical protein
VNNPVDVVQQAEAALRENPAFAAVMDKAKADNLPPEAVARLLLEGMDEGARATLLTFARMLDKAVVHQPAPPLMVKHSNGGMVLNPVVAAALAERVQLDGDVPEFRYGPLPEGATPAVPVKTTSRNLVEVGFMLERASREVTRELQAALSEHGRQGALLLDHAEQQGLDSALARKAFDALLPTGVKDYEAGALPALREVTPPTMQELAALSPSEERRLVWKTLSTTQGKRSLVPVFEQVLAERFPNIVFGGPPEKGSAEVAWFTQAFGADDLDPNFAVVENALALFTRSLEALQGRPYRACVQPLNAVSTRTFGWVLYVGGAI